MLNLVSFLDKEQWHKKIAQHEIQGEVSLLELLVPLAEREVSYLGILKTLRPPSLGGKPDGAFFVVDVQVVADLLELCVIMRGDDIEDMSIKCIKTNI